MMFELLLLAAVTLIVIGQLLPEDESDEQQKNTHPSPERHPAVHAEMSRKTKQPCQRISGRAFNGGKSRSNYCRI
jgi:hypothetical protein